ncbi:MAG: restriction endonuclease subunit S [Prevotella sp.]|nr:restriction endonuclease subunit S [Prevotella sp.]
MEWKEVRLGDIADVQTGPFGSQLHKSDYIAEGIPCIMPTNIGPHLNLVVDGIAHVSEVDANRLSRHLTEFGDIIYARRGDIEKCAYVTTNEEKWLCGTGCLKIRCKNEVNSRFIAYLLSTAECKKWITGNAVGTTMLNLSKGILSNLPLIIPSLVDQRRIASILSSLDRKIELNNKINADLEEMAQAIFKNWFVDFEPFKDGKFVDSELGMIPEGWKVGCLGDLITIKYGKDHKKLEDGTFSVYGSGGFMRYVNSWLYNGESVLIPRKGTLDNIMYVCEKFWTVDTMFFSVPKMDYVMKYVYNYIKRFDFSKMNEGTSVPSNTAARLNKMPILIPTHEILEMYDETLCPIYNKRKMKDKESRTLSLLRDTLLPRLMSGEIEVPE